jgi:RNA polymerase sigma-70 factor (ECF subfamily)
MVGAEGQRDGGENLAARAGPVRQWLTRFFRRKVGDQADVEDLVQDVFVRIAARDETYPIEHLDGYVLRTASSVLADRSRQRSARRMDQHVAFNPDLHGEADVDPDRIFTGKEELHVAIAALLSLPERTRTVFVLRRLEGLKMAEIATRLGLSVSAVEKHLVRAVSHLQAEMEKRHGP